MRYVWIVGAVLLGFVLGFGVAAHVRASARLSTFTGSYDCVAKLEQAADVFQMHVDMTRREMDRGEAACYSASYSTEQQIDEFSTLALFMDVYKGPLRERFNRLAKDLNALKADLDAERGCRPASH
jgi:hypothetical protein